MYQVLTDASAIKNELSKITESTAATYTIYLPRVYNVYFICSYFCHLKSEI